jgi:hypothetical protein
MATKTSSKIKSAVLMVFIVSSVFLVIGVWFQGLSDQEPATPRHIRPTLPNLVPEGFELTLTANPDQVGHELGGGAGQGDNREHGTPTPTVDFENLPTQDLPADLLDE